MFVVEEAYSALIVSSRNRECAVRFDYVQRYSRIVSSVYQYIFHHRIVVMAFRALYHVYGIIDEWKLLHLNSSRHVVTPFEMCANSTDVYLDL